MDPALEAGLAWLVKAEGALRCRFEPHPHPDDAPVRFRRVLCADPAALERVRLTPAQLEELARLGLIRVAGGVGARAHPRPFTVTDRGRDAVARRGRP